MIIIPDIHGRNFWKEAVAGREEDIIVFLGDYLDPYPDDFPDKTDDEIWEQTWNNFNDIIELKKKHPSNVVLLLGNHDLHYIYPKMDDSSRYDYERAAQIKEKFNENKDIFLLAYERTINGKRFIFSHAGIHKLWTADWFGSSVTDKNVVDYMNNGFLTNDPSLPRALDQYSTYRGGWESYGSMVWSDVREWWSEKPHPSSFGDVQVFGHTQLNDKPINFWNTYYDLDVRRGFLINENGDVCEMDGTPIPITEKD